MNLEEILDSAARITVITPKDIVRNVTLLV